MAKEALRYLNNAKDLLSRSSVEYGRYTDIKPVRDACGTAYLAVLKAIDEYLISRGVDSRDLPQSVDGYRNAINKYLSIRNGRLKGDFESLYKLLHIAGYYRGLLDNTTVVRDAVKLAKDFIERIK